MKFLARFFLGALMGGASGLFLFYKVCANLGDLWTMETGMPPIIFYSPIWVPIVAVFLTSLFKGTLHGLIQACLVPFVYILGGIAIVLIGGAVTQGIGGIILLCICLGLLEPAYSFIVIVFEED